VATPRAAVLAFLLYYLGSALLGEAFPFSRFSMYAGAGRRTEGATFAVLADGKPVRLRSLTRFSALEGSFEDPKRPTSLGHAVEEARGYVLGHRASDAEPPGPVRVEIGYRRIAWTDEGLQVGDEVTSLRCRAWNKP